MRPAKGWPSTRTIDRYIRALRKRYRCPQELARKMALAHAERRYWKYLYQNRVGNPVKGDAFPMEVVIREVWQ